MTTLRQKDSHYFSMLELMFVTAVISLVFALTAILIDGTKTSVINMSIQDNLATQGMDIMNRVKQDMAQSAIIFTPDATNGENNYVNLFDYGTHPQPYGSLRLPFESDTMNLDDADYNPDNAGNTIFFAKEFAPFNLVIEAAGAPKSNNGHGNNVDDNDPSNPGKKPGSSKTGPDLELHGYNDEWYSSDGALIVGSDAHYNIKRFQFMIYYIAEVTGEHTFINADGSSKSGHLNLVLAQTDLYADFKDVDGLAEPARSEVIAGLMAPISEDGGGISVFWDRDVSDPTVETAFYTFTRSNQNHDYTTVPLPDERITFISSEKLMRLSGTLSSGNYSVVYNDTPLNPRHTVPKFGPATSTYPAGFEIVISGNKQNRRIMARLVTAIAENGAIVSEENQMLFQASEVSAASGIYYYVPEEP